jgi:hypothetical protein
MKSQPKDGKLKHRNNNLKLWSFNLFVLILVSHFTYDANKFKNLDTALSFLDGSPITSSKSDIDPGEYSTSKLDELFDANILCDFINESQDSCATPILTSSYPSNEQSLRECQYDELELPDLFDGIFFYSFKIHYFD